MSCRCGCAGRAAGAEIERCPDLDDARAAGASGRSLQQSAVRIEGAAVPPPGACDGEQDLCRGRYDGTRSLRSAECLDPLTGEWSAVASMSMYRSGAAAAVLDGMLYEVGGWFNSGVIVW